MPDCMSDDLAECDCSYCTGREREWEHLQGWHDHRLADCPDCDDEPGCMGGDCLNPHVEHTYDECFTAEMAEAVEGGA